MRCLVGVWVQIPVHQLIHAFAFAICPPLRVQQDSYMLPFQACVEKGRVSSLMCSYNSINGVPSCANDWLQNTVARGDWAFNGYITSDCDADKDVFFSHNYTATPELAVKAVLQAGTDLDCGDFTKTYAQSALDKGVISMHADVEPRLRNQLRVRFRLGHFDPPGPLQDIQAADVVCSAESIALAHDGAAQGTTLLKNEGGRLPLLASALNAKTVAVLGPNGNLSKTLAGYYGPQFVCGNNYWNMIDAVRQQLSSR